MNQAPRTLSKIAGVRMGCPSALSVPPRRPPPPAQVHLGPIKTVERMREKLAEYAAEGADWPLAASILDPVCCGSGRAPRSADPHACLPRYRGWGPRVS